MHGCYKITVSLIAGIERAWPLCDSNPRNGRFDWETGGPWLGIESQAQTLVKLAVRQRPPWDAQKLSGRFRLRAPCLQKHHSVREQGAEICSGPFLPQSMRTKPIRAGSSERFSLQHLGNV